MATSRFADLSEDEMEEILNETESRNTKNVIQVASKLFQDHINNKLNLRSDDLHDKSNEEIVHMLRKFYCNIRKRNGEPYALTVHLYPLTLTVHLYPLTLTVYSNNNKYNKETLDRSV
jgi:hypothetical protein